LGVWGFELCETQNPKLKTQNVKYRGQKIKNTEGSIFF
jgi:hypothetical protein